MKSLIAALFFTMFIYPQEFIKHADNLNFPEGPAWDGKGSLYVSSCYGGYILKISGEESEVFIDSLSSMIKQTNGLTIGSDGKIYACDFGNGLILKIHTDKRVEVLSDGFMGKRYNRPNDLAFYKNGDLFFTDPKTWGPDKPDGRLFRLNPSSGEVELIKDSLCFPNGIAFSLDWNKMYLCESARTRILEFELDKNGSIISERVFADLPGGDPDGLALDEEGNLYAAHFGGGAVYVFSPDGKQKEKIITPGKKPSNIEFGGEELKTLFLTEDESNSVYSIRREIPGLRLIR
jgi:gluconolactonase